jgi:signal peptidase I
VDQSQSEVEPRADTGKMKGKQRPFWKELPILLGVALILALVIKTFLVQAFYIPSGSMQNTLGIGDRILVNKVVYHVHGIRREDIVVFKGQESWATESTPSSSNPVSRVLHNVVGVFGFAPSGTDYIKRVIGLPGDHVQCAGGGAPVKVNGKALDEKSYLFPGNAPCDEPFNITVPPGRLWVMGDHRRESADSRSHTEDPGGGAIKASSVIGKAFVTVWPLGSWKTL